MRVSIDYSLDRIGERIDRPELSPMLSSDDAVRVQWVLSAAPKSGRIVDIGASDGAISKRLAVKPWVIERHPAHRDALAALSEMGAWCSFGDAFDALPAFPDRFFDAALLCEVLEHHSDDDAHRLLYEAKRVARTVIVTVPNCNCESYKRDRRQRYDYPDHRSFYDARSLREMCNTSMVVPLVGELHDSIWLGAIA